jgi:hypothetical protein
MRYITMLRHPAETVGSRTTYYAALDAASQHRYALLNVARWVNNSLISERETRGFPRLRPLHRPSRGLARCGGPAR